MRYSRLLVWLLTLSFVPLTGMLGADCPWPVAGYGRLYVVAECQALPWTVVEEGPGGMVLSTVLSMDYFMDSMSGGVKSATYLVEQGYYGFFDGDNSQLAGPWRVDAGHSYYLHIDKDFNSLFLVQDEGPELPSWRTHWFWIGFASMFCFGMMGLGARWSGRVMVGGHRLNE